MARGEVVKRGDTYLVEIKEYRPEGLLVYLKIANQTLLLPAAEIKDGIKQKYKKMIGWFIPVRVKSLRPLAVTNMRLDKTKLKVLGLRDAKPIEKNMVPTTNGESVQAKESIVVERKKTLKEEPKVKKMELRCEPLLNGIMAYWDKVEDAAIYYVHLFIGEKYTEPKMVAGRMTSIKTEKEAYKEIATIEVPRNITYYSFLNLAKIDQNKPSTSGGYRCSGTQTGRNYYIYVEAEDRMGNTISKTDKVLGQVYIMVNGYYSLTN